MAAEGNDVFQQPQLPTPPAGLTGVEEHAPPAPRRLNGTLKHLRITARGHLGRLLAACRRPASLCPVGALVSERITSVLVCRVNARMGNALFLTPLIQELHELLPEAAIDIASAYPHAQDLLGHLPGVRAVIVFPYKGVQIPWRYLAALARVRGHRYDLVIDPTPNSTSSRIVLGLSRARLRLGVAAEHQWAPLTHAVPDSLLPRHRAIQPVFLLRWALGVAHAPDHLQLTVGGDASEQAEAHALVRRALELRGDTPSGAQPVGFFAYAAGAKKFGREAWLEFWKSFLQLAPEAVPVEFLPTPHATPLSPRFAALHVPTPRRLAAAMGQMCMFISADTGPMHLASSTAMPTVALFCASEPELYAPLKPCDLALDAAHHSPDVLARLCYQHWQRCRGSVTVKT